MDLVPRQYPRHHALVPAHYRRRMAGPPLFPPGPHPRRARCRPHRLLLRRKPPRPENNPGPPAYQKQFAKEAREAVEGKVPHLGCWVHHERKNWHRSCWTRSTRMPCLLVGDFRKILGWSTGRGLRSWGVEISLASRIGMGFGGAKRVVVKSESVWFEGWRGTRVCLDSWYFRNLVGVVGSCFEICMVRGCRRYLRF